MANNDTTEIFTADDFDAALEYVRSHHPNAAWLAECSAAMGYLSGTAGVLLSGGDAVILSTNGDEGPDNTEWVMDTISGHELRHVDQISIGLEHFDETGALSDEIAEADIAGRRHCAVTRGIPADEVAATVDNSYRAEIESTQNELTRLARLRRVHLSTIVDDESNTLRSRDRSTASAISRAAERLDLTPQAVRNAITKHK